MIFVSAHNQIKATFNETILQNGSQEKNVSEEGRRHPWVERDSWEL